MYDPRELLKREPVAIAAAVVAILQLLVLFDVVTLTTDQLAGINTALVLLLGLFARQTSTSTAHPQLKAGTSVHVAGSRDQVVIQPSPPGPSGVEGGTDGEG